MYLVNKPLSVVGMSGDNAQGLEIVQKMNSWPRSEALRPLWNFEDNLSAKSIILQYTSCRKSGHGYIKSDGAYCLKTIVW